MNEWRAVWVPSAPRGGRFETPFRGESDRRGCVPGRGLERVKGIEPSCAAWEAAVLPLNYTRAPGERHFTMDPPDRKQGYSAARAAGASPSFTPRTAYSAATRIASIMLTALALPVPAMSKAVP